MNKKLALGAILAIGLAFPKLCLAGMPSLLPEDVASIFRLNEEPQQRLQVISFFLLGLLVSTIVVRFCWNSLAKDFPRLPHLGFVRAFVVVMMWGTLFVIVLTMISGARELMTPGAWHKQGITYTLDAAKADRAPDQRSGNGSSDAAEIAVLREAVEGKPRLLEESPNE